jgi:hypothetical protein
MVIANYLIGKRVVDAGLNAGIKRHDERAAPVAKNRSACGGILHFLRRLPEPHFDLLLIETKHSGLTRRALRPSRPHSRRG